MFICIMQVVYYVFFRKAVAVKMMYSVDDEPVAMRTRGQADREFMYTRREGTFILKPYEDKLIIILIYYRC
jgi:hypothetical protein